MENSVPGPNDEPRAEYLRRLEAWKATQAAYDRQHRHIGIGQLALGMATVVVAGLALVPKMVSVLWVTLPLGAIIGLAIYHNRVLKQRERSSRVVAHYQRALARIDNSW